MSNILTANGGGDELQNVINLASSGDIILIEDGIYNPIIIDKDLTLSAKNEVNLLNNTASVFIKCNCCNKTTVHIYIFIFIGKFQITMQGEFSDRSF